MLDIMLIGLVAYVFVAGFYAIVEAYAISIMWPWVFRVGPVLSTWSDAWSGMPALPLAANVEAGRLLVRRTADSEAIFRSRVSFLGRPVGYKGRLVWNGTEVAATARWFHGAALVLAGFGLVGVYGLSRAIASGDLGQAAGLGVGLLIGIIVVWWNMREARREFSQDIDGLVSLIRGGGAVV
jgi:hypothetical protein